MQKMNYKEFKRKTGMRDKKRRKGTKMGSNASEDPLNFRGWVGCGRGPASDQGGSCADPEGGGGGPGPAPPLDPRMKCIFS